MNRSRAEPSAVVAYKEVTGGSVSAYPRFSTQLNYMLFASEASAGWPITPCRTLLNWGATLLNSLAMVLYLVEANTGLKHRIGKLH